MYDWQLNNSFTSKLIHGQRVRLNEAWSGYRYLERECGWMFPAPIKEIHDDVIVIGHTRFARQVLRAA